MADTAHPTADAGDLTVFYGEPGKPDAPTLALLHGLPSAIPIFREPIPLLADRFHLAALPVIAAHRGRGHQPDAVGPGDRVDLGGTGRLAGLG